MDLVVITPRAAELDAFARALARESGLEAHVAAAWPDALEAIRKNPPKLVVIDEGLRDGAPLDLARRLLDINPMVNAAVVSPLSGEAFHDASEGLGLVGAVPSPPGAEDGAALARAVRPLL